MPRLPSYTAEVRQHGVPSGRRATAGDFFNTSVQRAAGSGAAFAASAVSRAAQLSSQDPVGAGMQQLGQTVQQVAENYVQLKEQRDVAQQQVLWAQSMSSLAQELDQLEQQGEPGIPEAMEERLQEHAEQLRNSATTRSGMEAAERGIAQLGINIGQSARASEAKVIGMRAKEDTAAIIQANGHTLESEPEMLPVLQDNLEAYVRNIGLPAPVADRMVREGQAQQARTAAIQWINFDKDSLDNLGKKMLEAGRFDEWLPTEEKQQLIEYADRVTSRAEADRERERIQMERQAAATRQRIAVDAAIAMHDPENDPLVELDKIYELAGKTGPDGLPLVDFVRVQQLQDIADRQVAGEEIKTPHWLAQQLAVEELRTGAPAVETIDNYKHLMSAPDLRSYTTRARDATAEVRQYRRNHLTEALTGAGISEEYMQLYPGVSTVFNRLSERALRRQEQYRAAGEDPALYYTGGAKGLPSAEDDRKDFAPAFLNAMTRGEQMHEDIKNTPVGGVFADPEDPTQFYQRVAPGPITDISNTVRIEADSIEEARAKVAAAQAAPEADPEAPAPAAGTPDDPKGAKAYMRALGALEAEVEASEETGFLLPPALVERIRSISDRLNARRVDQLRRLREENPDAKVVE